MAGVIAWITTSAGFAATVRARLIVYDDAATTAQNILSHELLYRLAFAGDALSVLYVIYILLLYNLFKPVNRSVSRLAAWFGVAGCAVGTLNALFHLAPLVILKSPQSMSAFNPQQQQALALLFLKLHSQGYTISMLFFGTYNMLVGYLIFRSTFLPRILGVLLAVSGLCYEINNFSAFLAPDFAARLNPWILIPGVAELLLALWLVAAGVNASKWKEQAKAAESAAPVH